MTTGKTIALTRRNFVGKVMSLLLNISNKFVSDFITLLAALSDTYGLNQEARLSLDF